MYWGVYVSMALYTLAVFFAFYLATKGWSEVAEEEG